MKWVIVVMLTFAMGFGGFWAYKYLLVDPNAKPETILSLTSNLYSPKVGEEFNVVLNLSTNDNIVSQVIIDLQFDREKLELKDLEAVGEFVESGLPRYDHENGIEFRLTAKNARGFEGTTTIANIRFKAKKPGEKIISFGERTMVGASSELAENVLNSKNALEINILDN